MMMPQRMTPPIPAPVVSWLSRTPSSTSSPDRAVASVAHQAKPAAAASPASVPSRAVVVFTVTPCAR